MNLTHIFNNGKKAVKANSPEILTAFGVSGVVVTSYLAAKGAIQADRILQEGQEPGFEDPERDLKTKVRLTWKCYIPAVASGVITASCIMGASKANSKRTAVAVGAYSLTEKAFAEYREKVVEQLGENKEQKIRDEIKQDRVTKLGSKDVIITGKGEVVCCELLTGRYFKSDMETLRRAQNDINARINNERYVNLDEFYDLIGLPYTSQSNTCGWDSAKLMELEFTTTLTPDGTPCLAFDYNYVKPL
jgi:hypothetical protein